MVLKSTAEPLFGVLAEQGFGSTSNQRFEKCPVVCHLPHI
jgi:hypothetical protein